MMDRRAFVTGLAAVLAAPGAAGAQQGGKVHRVVFLAVLAVPDLVDALRQGLRELGWIEGQNYVLEVRSTTAEKIPGLAGELARTNPDVIVVTATAMPYLGQATANVPVVFGIGDDPVHAGYVASLARPGGRMTALTSLNIGLDAKHLEILKAALPGVRHIGVLSTRHDRAHAERVAAIEHSARSLGFQLKMLEASNAEELPEAFAAASRARVGALMVLGAPLLRSYQREIVVLGATARLPVISAWRELPDAGSLMSYGTSVSAMFRRAATYVDRILKGAKPGDLPVEQATTFELVINARTAKALGLTIPSSLLLRADQVIE
jgi:putative tryptophan/tyrosine transport system substrate-binding protein